MLLGVYVVERPLVRVLARVLDASWFPTVQLGLACAVLAATGWVVGRVSRPFPIQGSLIFAATLAFRDWGDTLGIRIPWLFRLAVDALREPRYWVSLFDTAASQGILFASLIAGALISRGAGQRPLSIIAPRGTSAEE
jgi:hypothetical protein